MNRYCMYADRECEEILNETYNQALYDFAEYLTSEWSLDAMFVKNKTELKDFIHDSITELEVDINYD